MAALFLSFGAPHATLDRSRQAMLSGFRQRRKTQEQTSKVRRRRRYCSIACRPPRGASRELRSRWLAECLWLEIWEQRCSAQNSIFNYFYSFYISQTNLSLFSCILSFSVILDEKSGFYARPPLFSESSQDFISSLFDFSH